MTNSFVRQTHQGDIRVYATSQVPPHPLLYLRFPTDNLSKIALSNSDQIGRLCTPPASRGDAGHRHSKADSRNALTLCFCSTIARKSLRLHHIRPTASQVEKKYFPCIPVGLTAAAPGASIVTRNAPSPSNGIQGLKDRFAAQPLEGLMFLDHGKRALLAATLVLIATSPGFAEMPVPAVLTAPQIVEQMQRHDQGQTERLKRYRTVRHYQAEYTGYSKVLTASMEVEVDFDAASGKSFRTLSQTGSKFLCDHVLVKALDSEKEVSKDKNANALTAANYTFQLAGTEDLNGRPTYILDVTPLRESKFLYRGRIWVDATDFAVAKFDVVPARSPSIWIARTTIRYTSAKTGDFWLPQRSRSETKVRIGGTALLTVDYGTYHVVPNASDRAAGR